MRVFLLAILAIFLLLPQSLSAGSLDVDSIVSNINELRSTDSQLTISVELNKTAQHKCDDLIINNYYAHTSPSGVTFKKLMESSGYDYEIAAENITINRDTASGAVTSWLGSKPHRVQMLNKIYTEIGVGISKGKLKGTDSTVVCTHFAKPSEVNNNGLFSNFANFLKIISISV